MMASGKTPDPNEATLQTMGDYAALLNDPTCDVGAKLYAQHYRRVYGDARDKGASVDRAHDLAQEAFLRWFRLIKAERYDPGVPIRSLLRTMLTNVVRDDAKRNRLELAPIETLDGVAAAQDDPESASLQSDQRRRTWNCVSALPVAERQLICQLFYAEISMRKLARDLQVDIGTVKRRRDAALGSLRRCLGRPAPLVEEVLI